MSNEIDRILEEDDIKSIIDAIISEIENMEELIVVFTTKDGRVERRWFCRSSVGIGLANILIDDFKKRFNQDDGSVEVE